MTASSAVTLELLGGFRVLTNGRSTARLPGERQQQLIAYLVLHARSAPSPRQQIAGSLWPESADAQALTNLRRELHHLRESFPAIDMLIDGGSRTLMWREAAAAIVDVVVFEAKAERGLTGDLAALQQAARLYKGDLLPAFAGEWIESDRERLRQRARKVLTHLVERLERDRAFGDAIEHAEHLCRIDPLDESGWRSLMRCHASRGDRAKALHAYQQCAALLKKELGVQPSAALRMTYREVLALDVEIPVVPTGPKTVVYPLVGRHREWQALEEAWHGAAAGRSRFFLIRGEAGVGKTRLAEELVDWCRIRSISALTARCQAGEGRLAYAPIAEWLKSEPLQPVLMKLEISWLTDVARLHPELILARPEVPAPDSHVESWQRLRFFESLTQAFHAAAPVLLLIDDLQWADGDTIEWLQYFMRPSSTMRCLVAGTLRAEEEQDNRALGDMLRQLAHDDLITAVSLGPLDLAATARLAGEVAEHPLDEAAASRVFHDTEGHPLFIVERGRMQETKQDGALPHGASIVAARLALLSDEGRAAAEVAAAIGRDFQFDILARASDLEEDVLVRALDELWRRYIVRVQADERWDFSHDRLREVAYAGIGPARRRLIHRRIAQGMELLFAGHLDEVSAQIATHLDRGGQPGRAIPFLERAAAVATRVSANEEAIRCLTYALSLLEQRPEGRDRDEQELALRSSLSIALNSAHGYASPEVEQNLNRVFQLSAADGRPVPARWLWVAFTMRFMLGDLKVAREMSERALALSTIDPSCRCEAHHAMGGALLALGELEAARYHFEAGLAAYDKEHPQRSALGSDLGVFGHAWGSHAIWLLGDEQTAVEHAEEAIVLARRLDHKYSETLALAYAALLHQMRGDANRTGECAEAAVTLCERYGFAYYDDWARVLVGWTRGRDRPLEGIEIIESALGRLDAQRAQARRPFYLSLLAETYQRAGDRQRARSTLDAAIAMAREGGDMWWLPALYLQKAEFEPASQRDAMLNEALDLARSQKSRVLEQRILARRLRAPSDATHTRGASL